jgi:hypothetical protein
MPPGGPLGRGTETDAQFSRISKPAARSARPMTRALHLTRDPDPPGAAVMILVFGSQSLESQQQNHNHHTYFFRRKVKRSFPKFKNNPRKNPLQASTSVSPPQTLSQILLIGDSRRRRGRLIHTELSRLGSVPLTNSESAGRLIAM